MARQDEIIAECSSDIAATKVLDAGYGYGRLSRLLLERLPGAEVIGCDISPAMVRACNGSLGSVGPFDRLLGSSPFKHLGYEIFVLCQKAA